MGFRRASLLVAALAFLTAVLWMAAASAQAAQYYGAVYFVDAQHGWLAGGDGAKFVVWSTSDGGQTLKRQSTSPAAGGGITSLAFSSRSTGLWTNDTAGIQRTTDGGQTWTTTAQSHLGIPRDVHFASAKVAWATVAYGSAGAGGAICRSTDGGASWRVAKTVETHDGNEFGSLSCPSPTRCYVLGSGDLRGVWVTADSGAHWRQRQLPGSTTTWYAALDFPTARTGWVIGGGGAILKTTDGGRTWKRQASGTSETLSAACFLNEKSGFLVGDGGLILRTVDGGKHWLSQQMGAATTRLYDVFFVNRMRGWAVGYGVRLRTVDGGLHWRRL